MMIFGIDGKRCTTNVFQVYTITNNKTIGQTAITKNDFPMLFVNTCYIINM